MEELNLPADLKSLKRFTDFIEEQTRTFGLKVTRIMEISLALEEALVNIFVHAYPEGEGWVQVRCGPRGDDRLVIEIRDGGIPFNSLVRPDPDTTEGIDERTEGGLGIFLMKKMIPVIEYRRENDMNVLTFLITKEQAEDEKE